jgi:DMSO/TMAO reductase YedYZ heme-binding membrane subunit
MTSKHAAPRHSRAGNRTSMGVVGLALGLTVVVVGVMSIMATEAGGSMMLGVRDYLEFYVGVFTLLGLTGTVVLGLVVGERTAVSIKHRILAQRLHRGFSLASIGFLLTHIALKVNIGSISLFGALIPFADGSVSVWAALGPVAGNLMLVVFITSVLRSRFAKSARPWMWRAIHATAYLSWPIGIAHGLLAGRSTLGPWVNWAYIFALVGVGVVLVMRPFLRSMGMPSTDIPGVPTVTASARKASSAASSSRLAAAAGGGGATVVTEMPAARAAYRSGGGRQGPGLRSVSPIGPRAVPDPGTAPGPQPAGPPQPGPAPQPGPQPVQPVQPVQQPPVQPAAQVGRPTTGPNPVIRPVDPDPSTGPLAQVYRLPAGGSKPPGNGPRSRRRRAK